MAIGTYLGRKASVLIGRDTRQTAELVQHALVSGLISCGCEVFLLHGSSDSPYVTTSTMAYATKHFNASAGIQVTASHNTPEYIGIKIWQNTGMGFTPEQEEAIDEIFTRKAFKLVQWNEVLKVQSITNANSVHVKAILDRMDVPLQWGGRHVTIVVDPGNGASCEIAPRLLQQLGVNVITINAQPDGTFPGRDSEPTETSLRTLTRMVSNDDELFLGIAFDGDADRVRFVDGTGTLIDGDRILLLLALYLPDPERAGRAPVVVTPVNSSTALDDTLAPRGIAVSRSRIGDISVAIKIQDTNALIGGEISGTYTWPGFHLGPDALHSAARLLEIVARHGPLEEIIKQAPQHHVLHASITMREEVHARLDDAALEGILHRVLDRWETPATGITSVDGVLARVPNGFLLVRLSGTSPMIRLTAEHGDASVAAMLMKLLEEETSRLAT